MASLRRHNWLGQGRVDVPHLRDIESSTSADFDVLAGRIVAGKQPLVVRGFTVVSTGITVAEQLQIHTADGVLIHYFATESGSLFQVPSDRPDELLGTTNPRVSGSFTSNQVNYVGLDLRRSTDQTTADVVMFLDGSTLRETPKEVPLARTLDYTIVVSTTDFSATPNLVPIAIVTTDASHQIVSIQDARGILGRLGSGGSVPDALHKYPWPAGRREGTGDPFSGGDKIVGSLKEWMDSAMTRLWELGGGEFWYSGTADRNVHLVRSGAVFVSSGEYFEWDGTHLHWKGLQFVFDNSTATLNQIANQTSNSSGLTDLADGDCIYVDLDRGTNRSGGSSLLAVKAQLATLGQGAVPGSRYAVAWRVGSNVYTRDQPYPIDSTFKIATTTTAGGVKLSATDGAAVTPAFVATVDSVTLKAYAGGLTRGSDFMGGPGNITIGGAIGFDQSVVIRTPNSSNLPYEVELIGSNDYDFAQLSAASALNLFPFDEGPSVAFCTRGVNHFGGDIIEDAHHFETGGAIGFRNAGWPLTTPAPVAGHPIRSKIFFQTNGLTSPNTVDQFCVMWWDGSVGVIASSPAY